MLHVLFHPRAKKELLVLPKNIRQQILKSLAELEALNHPLQHKQVLKLSGQGRQDFRLRVGSYRVKFTLRSSHNILITHVQHRQAGY
jgi:mRNA-degrading endonuclease RelE of RelBE toxin-antitoxin system